MSLLKSQARQKGPCVFIGCWSPWPALPWGMLEKMSFLQLSGEKNIACALLVFQLSMAALMQTLEIIESNSGQFPADSLGCPICPRVTLVSLVTALFADTNSYLPENNLNISRHPTKAWKIIASISVPYLHIFTQPREINQSWLKTVVNKPCCPVLYGIYCQIVWNIISICPLNLVEITLNCFFGRVLFLYPQQSFITTLFFCRFWHILIFIIKGSL